MGVCQRRSHCGAQGSDKPNRMAPNLAPLPLRRKGHGDPSPRVLLEMIGPLVGSALEGAAIPSGNAHADWKAGMADRQ